MWYGGGIRGHALMFVLATRIPSICKVTFARCVDGACGRTVYVEPAGTRTVREELLAWLAASSAMKMATPFASDAAIVESFATAPKASILRGGAAGEEATQRNHAANADAHSKRIAVERG